MRLAILLSFAVCGLAFSAAGASASTTDGPLLRVVVGSQFAFIVPESYAEAHKADIMLTIPGVMKLDGFWTPTELDVTVCDRVLRNLIQAAVKKPALLFPDLAPNPDAKAAAKSEANDQLEHERHELTDVSENYDSYARQYVGIIIAGQKLIFCNYSDGAQADPSSDYIYIHKVFVDDGTVHFLLCRFNPDAKTCANVSMIGSWPPVK